LGGRREVKIKIAELQPMIVRVDVNETLGTISTYYYTTKCVNVITPNTKLPEEMAKKLSYWWNLGFTKILPTIVGLGYGLKEKEWFVVDLRRNEVIRKSINPFKLRDFIALYVPTDLPISVPIRRVKKQI
jgi:hypothetical protein